VTHAWVDFEAGRKELLTDTRPSLDPRDVTNRGPNGLRWRTETFQDGRDVGIVLDGSPRIATLHRYELFAGLLLLGGAVGGALFGWLLLHRATQTLRAVSASVRKVQAPAETVNVDVSRAPDEIRDVVDAMHELLRNI
jgi:hypothetical protein